MKGVNKSIIQKLNTNIIDALFEYLYNRDNAVDADYSYQVYYPDTSHIKGFDYNELKNTTIPDMIHYHGVPSNLKH